MVVAVGEIRACVVVQHGVKKGESTCALLGTQAVPLSQEGRGLNHHFVSGVSASRCS